MNNHRKEGKVTSHKGLQWLCFQPYLGLPVISMSIITCILLCRLAKKNHQIDIALSSTKTRMQMEELLNLPCRNPLHFPQQFNRNVSKALQHQVSGSPEATVVLTEDLLAFVEDKASNTGLCSQ